MKKKISTLFICAATLAGVAVSTGAVNAAESTGSSKPATTATTTSSAATTTSSAATTTPSAKPAETTTSTTTADAAKTSTVTIHYYNKTTGAEISGNTQTVTGEMGSTTDVKLQVPAGFKYGKDNDMLKVEFNLAQKSVDVYVTPDSGEASSAVSAGDKATGTATNASATNTAASTTSGDAKLPATGSKSFVNVALAASGVVAMIAAAGYAIVSRFKAHKAK